MIPSIELPQDELLLRLKELVDIVADPDQSIKDPAAYAQAYARLINLVTRHTHKMESKYILHNLGAARVKFLSELTGNIYVRPEYGKKHTNVRSLKETATRGRAKPVNPAGNIPAVARRPPSTIRGE